MAHMNKKELMDRLTQRIYVFMYQIMEDEEYSIVKEDGVPLHLTEEELVWFYQNRENGVLHNNHHPSFDDMPISIQDRLIEGLENSNLEEFLEEEGIKLISIIFDFLPLELELALDEMKAFASQKNEKWEVQKVMTGVGRRREWLELEEYIEMEEDI